MRLEDIFENWENFHGEGAIDTLEASTLSSDILENWVMHIFIPSCVFIYVRDETRKFIEMDKFRRK